MKKVEIDKIDNYIYTLKDMDSYLDKLYNLNIEFLNITFEVKVNDIIYINDKLLKGNEMLTYGETKEISINDIDKIDSNENIVLIHENKIYKLDRIYG